MRADTGLHADQARWHIGKPRFHLAARPLHLLRCTEIWQPTDVMGPFTSFQTCGEDFRFTPSTGHVAAAH